MTAVDKRLRYRAQVSARPRGLNLVPVPRQFVGLRNATKVQRDDEIDRLVREFRERKGNLLIAEARKAREGANESAREIEEGLAHCRRKNVCGND
jgi:hypothetical protein